MEIYIGDGEYADSPGDDAEEAYDNWLFHISRESDEPDHDNETSDDDLDCPDFDPNWDDDEDWGLGDD